MPTDEPLRRLGGGRWQTRDGRFTIEPQQGTWAVVDATQTNDFGLPLVRGPFASLTAAREAIETARSDGPLRSPLADRLAASPPARKPRPAKPKRAVRPPARPEPPPEPASLRGLEPARHRAAIELIGRLERLGIIDAEAIARAEVADGEPALARVALERRIRSAIASAADSDAAGKAVVDVVLVGKDEALGTEWRLVDGAGRTVGGLDLSEGEQLGAASTPAHASRPRRTPR